MSKAPLYIRNCISEYTTLFPDDWIENLKWENSSIAQESLIEGKNCLQKFQRLCFINIARSVLCGEYITHKRVFDKIKSQFEHYWTLEHFCPNQGEDEVVLKYKSTLYELYESLDNHIKALFLDYEEFIVSVNEKIEFATHEYIFKITTETPSPSPEFQYFALLNELIFPLCYVEHHLSLNKTNIRQIIFVLERLKRIKESAIKHNDEECAAIFELSINKSTFILKKLLRKNESFEFLIDMDKKEISRTSLPDLPVEIQSFFSRFENIHDEEPYNLKSMATCQIQIFEGHGTFLQMAHLMHYYCSTDKSIEQIDNLLRQFNNKYNGIYNTVIKHSFDKHALCTLKNYMHNCRLSYLLKDNKYDLTKLEQEISNISFIQGQTLIYNFYPYKKAIDFIINQLKQRIEKRDIDFNYAYYINLLEKYIHKFDTNVKWCHSHGFYPVQSLINECLVHTPNGTIILPSTFSRPIDYNKLRQIREKYNSDLEYIKNAQIYIRDRKETENLKTQLKTVEKRYLEIGGILISIVTFLYGTINIISNEHVTPKQLLYSVFALGIILIIFASLLVVTIERWRWKSDKYKISLSGVIFIVYTIILCFLTFSENKNFPDTENDKHVENQQSATNAK